MVVGRRNDEAVVCSDVDPSFLRNFDARAMATHEHCIAKAKKSIRKSKLRRMREEFDLVKNNFKKAGTRQTAFMINKLRAASSFGKI